MKWKKTTKKKLVLIGISAYLFGIMGMPLVLADTGLPVDVGETLSYRVIYNLEYEGELNTYTQDSAYYSYSSNMILTREEPTANYFYLNWTRDYTDIEIDTSFTEEEDLTFANNTASYWLFRFYFGSGPISDFLGVALQHFPVMMNETDWANFPDDAQDLIQEFENLNYETVNTTGSSDSNSITLEWLRTSSLHEEFIEYSDDGICSDFSYTVSMDFYDSTYSLTRITSNIPGFPPSWFGLLLLGSVIGVLGWHRSRYR